MLGQEVMPVAYDPLVDAMPDAEVLRRMAELRRSYDETAARLPLASDYIERILASA